MGPEIRFLRDSNPGGDSEVTPPTAGEGSYIDGVVLKASDDLQDAAMGLYDSRLNARFALSSIQMQTLRLVGAAGTQGALQSELAATVGSENRNFFYVIRNLEQRGLVTKRPAVVATPRTNNYFSNHIQTNVVHLQRFAPDLGRDTRLLVALGFVGTRGHRLWRRLKGALVKKGCLEEFIGQSGSKPVKCIRLLQAWTPHSDDEAGSDEELSLQMQPGGGQWLTGRQVAEITLDRQLLQHILEAGPEGATVSELHEALALNSKRNSHRLRELERRFDLKPTTSNQGRMLVGKYRATPAMLAEYSGTEEEPGPAPPGVQEAAPPGTRKACGELHHLRMDWIVEEVGRAGFMLSAEIARFLTRREAEVTGVPRDAPPDRKTCTRVVDRAVAAGKLAVLSVNIPSKHGCLQNRAQLVLAPPETVPDEAFVTRVFRHCKAYSHHAHSRGAPNSVASLAAKAMDMGTPLPQVESKGLLGLSREGRRHPGLDLAAGSEIIGSQAEQDGLVSLAASGRTLACSFTSHPAASLTREESSWLWESPEAHTRCHIALSQLLDLLCRMGLLSSAVPLSSKSQSAATAGASAENLYYINTSACLERLEDRALETFSLETPTGADAYWSALEDAALETGAGRRGHPSMTSRLASCFPFDRAPEAAVGEEGLAHLSIGRCRELAADLDLHVDAVMAFVRNRKARLRAERLQGLEGWGLGPRVSAAHGSRPAGLPLAPQAAQRGRTDRTSSSSGSGSASESDSDSDVASGGEEAVGALRLPPSALFFEAPRRKQRWHQAEDRQLLRGWAGFVAAHGPEKILFWRSVPDRPPGLRTASLRHRLKVLQQHPDTAQAMARIKELAGPDSSAERQPDSSLATADDRHASLVTPSDDREGEQGSDAPGAKRQLPSGSLPSSASAKRPRRSADALEPEIAALIEAVAAAAPGQYKHASALPPAWKKAIAAHRQSLERPLPGGFQALARIVLGPSQGEDDAEVAGEAGGSAEAVGSLLPGSRPAPSAADAAAIALGVLCELDPACSAAPPPALDVVSLLGRRLGRSQIRAGVRLLVRAGAVNPVGSASNPLRISPRLKSLIGAAEGLAAVRPLRVQLHPNVPAGTDPEAAQQLGHLDADISVVVEPRQEAPATLAPAVEEATSPRVACMTAAPWLTHDGRLNATLWKALAARAVEAVAARPGIPYRELVSKFLIVGEPSAEALIDALCFHGVLALEGAKGVTSPTSVLGSCFSAHVKEHGADVPGEAERYVVLPKGWLGRLNAARPSLMTA
ncbi:hypothetical protein F751_2387 [Auxenochlorella protothecoides]|uniref:Uncharacterized protein n=1 Tax=Auxenochlorella protothecoides TaxID=3075 RepID=A0A087SG16_AUXPR|nr:hypothetical protein F751_2387 [Auxenochlorella protothecoides]KFM24670.1 hypothetical protein F751_2387 [Auxenochlorella protothecoides]